MSVDAESACLWMWKTDAHRCFPSIPKPFYPTQDGSQAKKKFIFLQQHPPDGRGGVNGPFFGGPSAPGQRGGGGGRPGGRGDGMPQGMPGLPIPQHVLDQVRVVALCCAVLVVLFCDVWPKCSALFLISFNVLVNLSRRLTEYYCTCIDRRQTQPLSQKRVQRSNFRENKRRRKTRRDRLDYPAS